MTLCFHRSKSLMLRLRAATGTHVRLVLHMSARAAFTHTVATMFRRRTKVRRIVRQPARRARSSRNHAHFKLIDDGQYGYLLTSTSLPGFPWNKHFLLDAATPDQEISCLSSTGQAPSNNTQCWLDRSTVHHVLAEGLCISQNSRT